MGRFRRSLLSLLLMTSRWQPRTSSYRQTGNRNTEKLTRFSLVTSLVLSLKLFFFCYLAYLAWFLLTGYHPEQAGYKPPFAIWLLDTINLFIHEAGHLFFRPFGMWLHIIAGSLFQIALPLALLIVTWREKRGQIVLPGFWLGESMVNVSAYIFDAPDMKLRLIASGLTRDWNYLLGGNRDAASLIGWMVFGMGLVIVAWSIAWGVWGMVRDRSRAVG